MQISELLREENMTLDLQATERIEASKELAELLYASGSISDREEILRAALQREEEFSTGIGFQVAIPHAKSSTVEKASIAYGFSKQGVEWPSEDGENPKMIFFIVVPETALNEHLRLLAKIARKLIHPEVREKILNAQTFEDVISAFDD